MTITPEEIQKIIEDAWRAWGTQQQMTQLSEEMMELGVEINKKYNRGQSNDMALIEEYGDVLAMIQQTRHILQKTIPDFEDRLERSMEDKWLRTRKRLSYVPIR